MLILLSILNCLAFIFMAFALKTLSGQFKSIFIASATIPLFGAFLFSVLTEHALLPFQDLLSVLGFLFRGWFIACIASGAAGCYIATNVKARK